MKYNLIIWDFNGTICDDVVLGINCINKVLVKRNMALIGSKDSYRDLFCFPIIDYYRKLGFDFMTEPYEILANEWTAEYLRGEHTLKASEGVVEVLEYIKSSAAEQIIISASEITMLKRELEIIGVADYFDKVLGINNTFGGGKIDIAKEWMKGRNDRAVFIGDTLHDFETATAIGCDCILYSGGHDSKDKLLSSGVPVVDKLTEVIDLI